MYLKNLKRAAIAAVASTVVFAGGIATAQESDLSSDAQAPGTGTEAPVTPGDANAGSEDSEAVAEDLSQSSLPDSFSAEKPDDSETSSDVKAWYKENKSTIDPILITLGVIQAFLLVLPSLRTIIYQISGA